MSCMPRRTCDVLTRRAWDLARDDIIRLQPGQGKWREPASWPVTVIEGGRRISARPVIPGTWREVLDVYRDRDRLPAYCGQPHGSLVALADEVFENREDCMMIRLLVHELSNPEYAEDLFVVIRRVELVEAQSLPAPRHRDYPDGHRCRRSVRPQCCEVCTEQ